MLAPFCGFQRHRNPCPITNMLFEMTAASCNNSSIMRQLSGFSHHFRHDTAFKSLAYLYGLSSHRPRPTPTGASSVQPTCPSLSWLALNSLLLSQGHLRRVPIPPPTLSCSIHLLTYLPAQSQAHGNCPINPRGHDRRETSEHTTEGRQ